MTIALSNSPRSRQIFGVTRGPSTNVLRDGGGVTAWDVRVARSAALYTLLAFSLALLVTSATDEGGVALSERIGRTLPTLPLDAGFGAWLALRSRRGRGELRALAATGRAPARAALAAAVGAALLALATTAIATSSAESAVAAFFPSARATIRAHHDGQSFVEDASGARIDPASGTITLPAASAEAARAPTASALGPRGARPVTQAVLALASLAFALLGARGVASRRDLIAIAATVATSVVAFHAAAAGRIGAGWSVFPTLGLIVFAVLRYGDAAWPPEV